LAAVPHLPDSGPAWYYWKLPEPTFWSRATAWGFYLLHQLTIWGLIYYAQRSRPRYTTGLHKFNIAALGARLLGFAYRRSPPDAKGQVFSSDKHQYRL
jgi:hypothetical protein